jgi:hypothetical protein
MMAEVSKETKEAMESILAKAKAGSPFPGLSFAGELDDLASLPMEVTISDKWVGYINGRVLANLNELHAGRLSHLRFLPDKAEGHVIIVPGEQGEYGAEKLEYSPTENGATVNLRLAVKRFDLAKQTGRNRVFEVFEKKAPDGSTYLAFLVKDSETRPARKVKASMPPVAAGQEKPEAPATEE